MLNLLLHSGGASKSPNGRNSKNFCPISYFSQNGVHLAHQVDSLHGSVWLLMRSFDYSWVQFFRCFTDVDSVAFPYNSDWVCLPFFWIPYVQQNDGILVQSSRFKMVQLQALLIVDLLLNRCSDSRKCCFRELVFFVCKDHKEKFQCLWRLHV